MKMGHGLMFLQHVLPSYIQAITTYAEKPEDVSAVDLFWIITELLDDTWFREVSRNISHQLRNTHQHDQDYQWALSLIDVGLKNKTKIEDGTLRSLAVEIKHCRAMTYNSNITKLERSTSNSDLKTFRNVEDILAKIWQLDYLHLAGQRYSANINQFLHIMLPLEYSVSFTRNFLENHLIKLDNKLTETKATFYKSEETTLLVAVIDDIENCLRHFVSLDDLDLRLDKHLGKALRLPHGNMFFQALGALGRWPTTAIHVNEAALVVKKMLRMLNIHSYAIESVYPCKDNPKLEGLTPTATL